MTPLRTLAFAGLTIVASMSAASAAQMQVVPADQFSALYQGKTFAGTPYTSHYAFYGHSGSIGRLNYGASPAHPEGPANFSD